MKILNIILIFSLVGLSVRAQDVTFQANLGQKIVLDKHKGAIQMSDESYCVFGYVYQEEPFTVSSFHTKVSETGMVGQSVSRIIEDSTIFATSCINIPENQVLSLNIIAPKVDYKHDNILEFLYFDNDLNTVNRKTLKFPADTMGIITAKITEGLNGEYLIYGMCVNETAGGRTFFYKLDSNLDSLHFKFTVEDGIQDLLIFPDGSIVYSGPYISFHISKYNYSDLSFESKIEVFYQTQISSIGWMYLEKISETEFVFSGQKIPTYEMYLVKMNVSDLTITGTSEFISYNNYDGQLPQYKGIARNSQGDIYEVQHFPSFGYNKILISKTDSELNTIWVQEYSIDIPVFWLSIIATSDNGFLLSGGNMGDVGEDIVLIKGTSEGAITNTEFAPNIKVSEQILYPNPGTAELTVRTAVQALGGEFTLCDISGKLILQQTINEQITTLNTTHLPAGTYLHTYIREGAQTQSGVWVKQ